MIHTLRVIFDSKIVFLIFQNMNDMSYMVDMSLEVPNPVQETSIQEDAIGDIPPQADDPRPEYEAIDHGTKRGRRKLVRR